MLYKKQNVNCSKFIFNLFKLNIIEVTIQKIKIFFFFNAKNKKICYNATIRRILLAKNMIKELLDKKQESDLFDIKLKYYEDDKKFALIKDVVSFANCSEPGDKYIIFGVENKTFAIKGISDELPDISDIQSLLNTYIEPNIEFNIDEQIIDGKIIKYIKIKNFLNKPYMIKQAYSKNGKTELREGEIYIRKNATNSIATRNDLMKIFITKENFSVTTNENIVSLNSILLLLELKNETSNTIDITKMTIRIFYNQQEFSISKSYLYNKTRNIKNKLCIDKENKIRINPYSKRLEWLYFDIDDKLFKILSKNNEAKVYLNIKNDKYLNMDVKL